jgi:hypothetical protein
MKADDSIRPFTTKDFFRAKGERMGLSRREFVQGAVAGAALAATPGTGFAAYAGDDADKQAVLQQIPKSGSRFPRSPRRTGIFRKGRSIWRSWRAMQASPA